MTTQTDREIARLIQEAVKPEDRAVLMVLLQINRSLHDTSVATRTLARELGDQKESLTSYITNGVAAINRASGAWRATTIIGGLAMTVLTALGGFIAKEQLDAIRQLRIDVASHEVRMTKIETEHNGIPKLGINR